MPIAIEKTNDFDLHTSPVKRFPVSSGIMRSMTLDTLAIGLRHNLAADGAVCCVRRDTRLRVRAMLAGRWHWSDAETVEMWLVGLILGLNPYAKIAGVQLRKCGRFIEAEVAIA